MFQLVYSSTARSLFTKADIADILSVSRGKNRLRSITGVLLYRTGSIVQVLEGEKIAVRQLYWNIERDKRHHHVTIIYTRSIELREFSEWTMGFHALEVDLQTPLDGFNPMLHATNRLTGANGRGAALLRTFADVTR